jgi:multisubunit Na+/H+ antiporter MnhG subunit
MVVFFYAVGQLVMVRFADAGARTLLSVSMASYTGRVVVLGVILMVVDRNRDNWHWVNAITVFITTIAVVAGWLIVEVVMFTRLRIGAYDQGYSDPVDPGDRS